MCVIDTCAYKYMIPKRKSFNHELIYGILYVMLDSRE